ncbi:hypothetical protein SAMN06265338_101297 [Rhodoblastus acidophilus]|uniref:Uncharacterized protein n=1 Tax=Rhodoblastus acidophilus TaxID=1074 RepID=A0A212Q0B6_RHOAC|nr:hypothetical protein [Rhodoblastus acidophilus]PPQ38807.1 hypothetical protein CKO16_09365 [Rhodoblastus acidophilus]RAI20461.1 hypothetical protein CH337_09595 [Rhodoblastus acidophilus]SNB52638.1 hypothetical protein SAMN06265338_101297 [Rhodoblastus acidophilus]
MLTDAVLFEILELAWIEAAYALLELKILDDARVQAALEHLLAVIKNIDEARHLRNARRAETEVRH